MRTDTNLHWWEALNDAFDATKIDSKSFLWCFWMTWE